MRHKQWIQGYLIMFAVVATLSFGAVAIIDKLMMAVIMPLLCQSAAIGDIIEGSVRNILAADSTKYWVMISMPMVLGWIGTAVEITFSILHKKYPSEGNKKMRLNASLFALALTVTSVALKYTKLFGLRAYKYDEEYGGTVCAFAANGDNIINDIIDTKDDESNDEL